MQGSTDILTVLLNNGKKPSFKQNDKDSCSLKCSNKNFLQILSSLIECERYRRCIKNHLYN